MWTLILRGVGPLLSSGPRGRQAVFGVLMDVRQAYWACFSRHGGCSARWEAYRLCTATAALARVRLEALCL
eukprot:1160396-Pelagomonas_calceolata.AAC.7